MMFSGLDWVIIAIIGLSTIFGFLVGFIRSILSVLVWVVSLAASIYLGPSLAHFFSTWTDNPSIQLWASYGVIFVAAVIVGFVIKMVVNLVLMGGNRSFGGLNSLLGAGFGFVRGMLLIIVLMWFALLCGFNQTGIYQQSRLAPYFTGMTTMIAQLFPGATTEIQQTMSSVNSGAQGLMSSASGELGGVMGSGSGGSSGGEVSGAVSNVESGLSTVTSSIKSNLGSM